VPSARRRLQKATAAAHLRLRPSLLGGCRGRCDAVRDLHARQRDAAADAPQDAGLYNCEPMVAKMSTLHPKDVIWCRTPTKRPQWLVDELGLHGDVERLSDLWTCWACLTPADWRTPPRRSGETPGMQALSARGTDSRPGCRLSSQAIACHAAVTDVHKLAGSRRLWDPLRVQDSFPRAAYRRVTAPIPARVVGG
jgi:hypothetical protein